MSTYKFTSDLTEIVTTIVSNSLTISSIQPEQPPYVAVTDGRHTSTVKLGKFLLKHNLPETRVKELVEEYKLINSSMDAYITELTTDYVEVYKTPLYSSGSSYKSCMTGENCVRVYGYDDRLSLLTITIKDVLAARTLVRSDTKEYVRLYLDHNVITPSIAQAIVEDREGYTEGDLEGIQLERIEEDGAFVCPYLDGISSVDDRGNYLVISKHGSIEASNTNGLTNRVQEVCPCCGGRFDEEDMCYDERRDESVCESCWGDYNVYYNGDYYPKSDCTEVSNGEFIPTDMLWDEGYVLTVDDEWVEEDKTIYIEKEDAYYLLDDVTTLVWEFEGEQYTVDKTVYNGHDLQEFPSGYYLLEQLEERIAEIEESIATMQADMFNEVEAELSVEEADALTIEIELIKELLRG